MSDTAQKRIVYAPGSYPLNKRSSAVNSVSLSPDEEVEWTFSYCSDGSRYVSGYIVTKKPKEP